MTDTALTLKPDTAQKVSKSVTFTPTNFVEAVQFAKMLSTSELVPKDYRGKHTNILVAMQMGAEVGLSPMAALQSIAVINGKPSVYGDAALAIVQVHPAYEWHKESIAGDGDARTASCVVKRKGQEESKVTFSVADAKKANLWAKDGPWKQYPDRMLQMRARGFALRDKFADALRGMILVEEAGDYTQMNIRPTEIERATLEPMNAQQALDKMSVSNEPNRGHGQESMERQKKPEKTICAECRVTDGHAEDCAQNPKNNAQSGKKSRRENWDTYEGHDPKVHISFDEFLQMTQIEKKLGVEDKAVKEMLDREFEIQHRPLIRKDQFQQVLDTMNKCFAGKKNSPESGPDFSLE